MEMSPRVIFAARKKFHRATFSPRVILILILVINEVSSLIIGNNKIGRLANLIIVLIRSDRCTIIDSNPDKVNMHKKLF